MRQKSKRPRLSEIELEKRPGPIASAMKLALLALAIVMISLGVGLLVNVLGLGPGLGGSNLGRFHSVVGIMATLTVATALYSSTLMSNLEADHRETEFSVLDYRDKLRMSKVIRLPFIYLTAMALITMVFYWMLVPVPLKDLRELNLWDAYLELLGSVEKIGLLVLLVLAAFCLISYHSLISSADRRMRPLLQKVGREIIALQDQSIGRANFVLQRFQGMETEYGKKKKGPAWCNRRAGRPILWNFIFIAAYFSVLCILRFVAVKYIPHFMSGADGIRSDVSEVHSTFDALLRMSGVIVLLGFIAFCFIYWYLKSAKVLQYLGGFSKGRRYWIAVLLEFPFIMTGVAFSMLVVTAAGLAVVSLGDLHGIWKVLIFVILILPFLVSVRFSSWIAKEVVEVVVSEVRDERGL